MIEIIGSILAGIILGSVFSFVYAFNPDYGSNHAFDYYSNTLLLVSSLAITLAVAGIGGYFAGKIAKQHEILCAICVGIVGVLFGLFYINQVPLWYFVVSSILIIPCASFGGLLAKRVNALIY